VNRVEGPNINARSHQELVALLEKEMFNYKKIIDGI
jgi:hypothetical protein